MENSIIEMKPGKIYMLNYGGTEVLGRYKSDDTCHYYFYDYLHYWAGYESFRNGDNLYCVKSGLVEVREATQAEKYALLRFSIAENTI